MNHSHSNPDLYQKTTVCTMLFSTSVSPLLIFFCFYLYKMHVLNLHVCKWHIKIYFQIVWFFIINLRSMKDVISTKNHFKLNATNANKDYFCWWTFGKRNTIWTICQCVFRLLRVVSKKIIVIVQLFGSKRKFKKCFKSRFNSVWFEKKNNKSILQHSYIHMCL